MERRNPKKKTGSEGHDGNSADRGVWKGLFKKLNKDRALRKALSDMGILEEEDGEVGAAETLHRILDAIKAGSLSSSAWRAAPDDESCSSSEDEDEEGREFANVGDPTQQYEYNARSVTKTVQFTPVDNEAEFDPNEPLAWSERNGMGRILVTPLPQFFKEYFETKPLHERVAGGDGAGQRFSSLLSEDAIFSLMAEKGLRYGQDVDVTIVGGDDVRQTLNGVGRVDAGQVKSQFLTDGCSVRLLHPQRFSDPLWSLMYKLECFWGSCVGCNAYLTPKGSQRRGFAPHFDDVDVFVLQVSGKKKWRLYRSPEDSLVLPRYSSRDFTRGELGKPFWKGTLHAGDVLYLPRGMIHDAVSVEDTNSLHVTISMNQRNNYFEFLTSLFSDALESSARDQVAFRRTLPVRYLMPEDLAKEQMIFDKQVDRLMESAFLRVNRPSTICRAFSEFMLNRLPPPLDAKRFPCLSPTSKDVRHKINDADGFPGTKLEAGMSVTLTFPQSAYAELDVSGEEPALFVYHCLSNSRDLHQTLDDGEAEPERVEPQLEVPLDCGPALHTLLSGEILPLDEKDMAGDALRVIDLAQALLDAGILSVVAGEVAGEAARPPPLKRRR